MKKVAIYTNGISKFTLENYDKVSGVCHVHGITKVEEVSIQMKRAMHSKGQIHYVIGIGDRKHLSGIPLKRGMEIGGFEIA